MTGKIQHNPVTPYHSLIAHYGCRNNESFIVKFEIIIHLKIISHVRIGITPYKTMVYAEFSIQASSSGFITLNHGKFCVYNGLVRGYSYIKQIGVSFFIQGGKYLDSIHLQNEPDLHRVSRI